MTTFLGTFFTTLIFMWVWDFTSEYEYWQKKCREATDSEVIFK